MQEKSTKTTPVIQLNLILKNPNKLGFLEQSKCRRTVGIHLVCNATESPNKLGYDSRLSQFYGGDSPISYIV